jgi:hypothetical protein
MKITFGKYELGFKYYYLIAFFLIMLTDGLLYDLVFGANTSGEASAESVEVVPVEKYLILMATALSIMLISSLNSFTRNWTIFIFSLLVIFMLESYYNYYSFMKYPHVFSKVMVYFLVPFAYISFKYPKPEYLLHGAYFIVVAFILNLVIYKSEVLSLQSFVDTERGFTAQSTYFILLPGLFFLNVYLRDRKMIYLMLFMIILFFILYLQHRTVWLSTLFALSINFLLIRKADFSFPLSAFTPFIAIPLIAGFLLFSFVLSTNPEVLDKLVERVEDIQNVESQGTGSWRLEQFKSYWPFIEDNLAVGMRLQGFELPIQFYHAEAGIAFFDDGTGHHFHSFYVDRLFYFGLLGIVMVLPLLFYFVNKVRKKYMLSAEQITLVAYISSGLIFGISYNLPTFYFGILGIAMSYIHQTYILEPEEETYAVYSNTGF